MPHPQLPEPTKKDSKESDLASVKRTSSIPLLKDIDSAIDEILTALLEEVTDDIGRTYADHSEVQGYLNMHPINETIVETKSALKALLADQNKKLAKAYGGCIICYGKGYATVRHGETYRGTTHNMRTDIKYCTCDRGKQLEFLFTEREKSFAQQIMDKNREIKEAQRLARVEELVIIISDLEVSHFDKTILYKLLVKRFDNLSQGKYVPLEEGYDFPDSQEAYRKHHKDNKDYLIEQLNTLNKEEK
jgi:hypothetical protein